MPAFHLDVQNGATPHLRQVLLALADQVPRSLNKQLYRLQGIIRSDKLSGQVLHVRSGNLRNAVHVDPAVAQEGRVEGALGLGREAWYGKIHEFGGTFIAAHKNLKHPAHLVTRKRGERVMTGSPYGVHYPERSFWRSTFREQGQRTVNELRADFSRVAVTGRES